MELDLKDLKPSVFNWFMIGLMAVSFIVFWKWIVNQYPNSFTDLVKPFMNAV